MSSEKKEKSSVKIAIASSGKDLTSPVDPRFGRCPYFLLVDSQTKEFEVLENKGQQAFRGAGVSAAQMVVNQGVKAVIAGNFGPRAFQVFGASRVKVFGGVSNISAQEALEQYREGKLKETTAPSGTFFYQGREPA